MRTGVIARELRTELPRYEYDSLYSEQYVGTFLDRALAESQVSYCVRAARERVSKKEQKRENRFKKGGSHG